MSLALFTRGGKIYDGHSTSGLFMTNALCLLLYHSFSLLGSGLFSSCSKGLFEPAVMHTGFLLTQIQPTVCMVGILMLLGHGKCKLWAFDHLQCLLVCLSRAGSIFIKEILISFLHDKDFHIHPFNIVLQNI